MCTPCTQSAVRTSSGPVPARTLIFDDFPLTEAGRLDLTLDWTTASSPMGLYLVPAGTCTLEEFNQRTCNFLLRSEPPGTKPRRVSSANLQAGNYRSMVANFGTESESAALQIVLSKGACLPISSLPPSTAARENAAAPGVVRAERR